MSAKRRKAGRAVILLSALLASGAVAAEKKPNVILVSLDAVPAGHMESYGYARPTMPFLRELARENVSFERAYAQAAFTLPSHYSMFTGVNPYTHAVVDMSVPPSHEPPAGQMLDPGVLTLTEYLKRAGYSTFASARLWDPHLNFTRGLDRAFDVLTLPLVDHVFEPESKEALFRLLRTAAARNPAFLFFYSWGGHDPYRPAKPDDTLFGKKRKKKKFQTEVEVTEMLHGLGSKGRAGGKVDPSRDLYFAQFDLKKKSDVEQLTDLYDGGLHTLDGKLRALFAMLKEAGLYDDSIIIVTADHGEAFGEHGLFLHSAPYENEIHVPLIMKIPGYSGVAVRSPVREIDILPTVLDLLGLKGNPNVEGKSLVPLVKGGDAEPALYYSIGFTSVAYRKGPWKLISWPDRRELFNLDEDPQENHDLAAKNRKKTLELAAELAALQASHSGKR